MIKSKFHETGNSDLPNACLPDGPPDLSSNAVNSKRKNVARTDNLVAGETNRVDKLNEGLEGLPSFNTKNLQEIKSSLSKKENEKNFFQAFNLFKQTTSTSDSPSLNLPLSVTQSSSDSTPIFRRKEEKVELQSDKALAKTSKPESGGIPWMDPLSAPHLSLVEAADEEDQPLNEPEKVHKKTIDVTQTKSKISTSVGLVVAKFLTHLKARRQWVVVPISVIGILVSAIVIAPRWVPNNDHKSSHVSDSPSATPIQSASSRAPVVEPMPTQTVGPPIGTANTTNSLASQKETTLDTAAKISETKASEPISVTKKQDVAMPQGNKSQSNQTNVPSNKSNQTSSQGKYDYSLAPQYGTPEDRRKAEEQLEIIRALRGQ